MNDQSSPAPRLVVSEGKTNRATAQSETARATALAVIEEVDRIFDEHRRSIEAMITDGLGKIEGAQQEAVTRVSTMEGEVRDRLREFKSESDQRQDQVLRRLDQRLNGLEEARNKSRQELVERLEGTNTDLAQRVEELEAELGPTLSAEELLDEIRRALKNRKERPETVEKP